MTDDGYRVAAPDFSAFAGKYQNGQAQLVYRRVPGDLDTPVSAYLKLAGGREDSFLLESVEGGNTLGRYTTIGLKPDLVWRAFGQKAEINRRPQTDPDGFATDDLSTISSMTRVIKESHIHLDDETAHRLPPMAAGMFGYFGYDFVRLTEHLPNKPDDIFGVPDGYFVRPTILAIFDNVKREVVVITPVRPSEGLDARAAYSLACERLADVLSDLNRPVADLPADVELGEFSSNMTPADYSSMVDRAKEYIGAGDIFQVVLSQRYSADYAGDPFHIYRQLRRVNPSPFLFFLNFRPVCLLGASPEILVRVRDGEVTIRPIAGTRRRGLTQAEDTALEEELLNDPKELSEHLMLLDLGRNDVGRSCEIGTVKPTDTFFIERYSHVMHIVSNVTGKLRADLGPLDALANGFPAGTLTGAPKVRAMQIIDELEPDARGPYGGCIGYFGADGSVDTCIGLRMAVVKDGKVHIQAGAGIVADSVAASENDECYHKSEALKEAARRAALRGGNR
ncbi:anthranilate synthase component I [Parvularcula sp. LCG005]|uniref:anthranilate synthase component I n=1 Tax=Parvularcula sp. LCG005 TaxID=3078805 RepID=UPI002943AB39|nr:anthranilate synthase component I [Parvularcula sp. LCG005]WOI52079.1 anthranilate synthase component I [Parvularcula sp. LCG005]